MPIAFLIVLLITLPATVMLRYLLGRRVAAMMLRKSTAVATFTVPPPDEVAASSTLGVAMMDVAAPAVPEAAAVVLSPKGRWAFRLWWAAEVVGAMLIALFTDPRVAVAYLLFLPFRYRYHARLMRGGGIGAFRRPNFFRRWIAAFFEIGWALFFHPRFSWFPILSVAIFGAILASAEEQFFRETGFGGTGFSALNLPLALLAGGLPFLVLRAIAVRRLQAEGNQRLLILRVFGHDPNADLVFGALRRAWQYRGSSYTVVDRSYLAFKYRGHSEDHLAVALLALMPILVIGGIAANPPTLAQWAGLGVATGLTVSLGYALVLIVMYFRAPRYFASDRAQIRRTIDSVLQRPRTWSLGFRELDMYCYDNTWRLAVADFIGKSDAVLMDLRGYGASNTGCSEEIDILFDRVAVGRIVILVDEKNDLSQIEDLLRARWRSQDRHSPNLTAVDPVVAICRVKHQDDGDLKQLLRVLRCAADGDASSRGVLAHWTADQAAARKIAGA